MQASEPETRPGSLVLLRYENAARLLEAKRYLFGK